jgi:hypothetical protein
MEVENARNEVTATNTSEETLPKYKATKNTSTTIPEIVGVDLSFTTRNVPKKTKRKVVTEKLMPSLAVVLFTKLLTLIFVLANTA